MGFKGQGVQRQQSQGFAFAGFHLGIRVGRTATQGAQGVAVQVFQQLAFPGVPYLGAGATDIGHRQQVQRREVALVDHAFGKVLNHIRVTQVLLLCDAAHAQVLGHQKLDQIGILFADGVVFAKTTYFCASQLRVVTATAFGNVVKQSAGVQDPRLVPSCSQLRAKRVLVGMFCHEKTPHIAQHHQDVLIHRVDMKQVVLHLAHDAPKHPQIAA